MSKSRIIIISNDIIPGMEMPVAAPGLRAFGLARGLRENGFKVETLIPKGIVERQWWIWGGTTPFPTPPNTFVIKPKKITDYLKQSVPAVVLLINSNQVDHVQVIPGIRYVLDLFAPKMLELNCSQNNYSFEKFQNLRQRKLRAIGLADAFIINGQKKVPYFLSWILESERDIKNLSIEVVNMCIPPKLVTNSKNQDGITRFSIAGYLQQWHILGGWVDVLKEHLEKSKAQLNILTPTHWGGGRENQDSPEREVLNQLNQLESVKFHQPMRFSDFQFFLSTVDVYIDLFQHNLEREYAMVTRSIVALSCGCPVIHPPFTEVSLMIAQYDAGWLIDPTDTQQFELVLQQIEKDFKIIQKKAKNARLLAAEILKPAAAVQPLVQILNSWQSNEQ